LAEKNYQSGLKTVLILISISYFLKLINFIRITDNSFFSYALLLYGIVAVYSSFNTNRKVFLFLSTALFMTGVLLFILENFDVINPNILILPAIIFIFGAGFLILYLENFSNKIFLYNSLWLFLFSLIFIVVSRYHLFRSVFNFCGKLFLDYYPLLIIITGILLIIRRKE
jgi:hypothetical protein